jgi:hypothetical protein
MRLPTDRAPTTPGEILLEEWLKPMKLTQLGLAKKMGVDIQLATRVLCYALFAVQIVASSACTRQVCECAVHVGGTTPANEDEQRARHNAVRDCLEKHGGGTITGCPMPPSLPPMPQPVAPTPASADPSR